MRIREILKEFLYHGIIGAFQRIFLLTREYVDESGWIVSLATNLSILVLIRITILIKECLTEFLLLRDRDQNFAGSAALTAVCESASIYFVYTLQKCI